MESPKVPTLVFTYDFDERTAYEAELKGWFDAVSARLPNGLVVPLSFRDPVRLGQDLESEVMNGKCCLAEPALIVVPRVTRDYMDAAIAELHVDGYFDRLLAIGQGSSINEGI
jgi:hypothetical protein